MRKDFPLLHARGGLRRAKLKAISSCELDLLEQGACVEPATDDDLRSYGLSHVVGQPNHEWRFIATFNDVNVHVGPVVKGSARVFTGPANPNEDSSSHPSYVDDAAPLQAMGFIGETPRERSERLREDERCCQCLYHVKDDSHKRANKPSHNALNAIRRLLDDLPVGKEHHGIVELDC